MIFNYNFVRITFPSSMQDFGEFTDMDRMVGQLDELRKAGKLLAAGHAVNMLCYTESVDAFTGGKSSACYTLTWTGNSWALSLPKQSATSSVKERNNSGNSGISNQVFIR